ncbi:MAG: hypothetical protein U0441_14185 [Polyangiaceae bacterium]
MSIELEVRLGGRRASVAELLDAIAQELRAWPSQTDHHEPWELSSSEDLARVLSGEEGSAEVTLSSTVGAEILASCPGSEAELGEDGGTWLVILPRTRYPAAITFTLLVAACLARVCGAKVVDESGLVSKDRFVDAETVLAVARARRISLLREGQS